MTISRALGAICAIAALAGPALAGDKAAAQDPLAPLRHCRQLADMAAKAACYDQAMDALEADRAAHKFSIVSGDRIKGLQREAFGFHMPSLPKLRLFGKNSLQVAETEKGTVKVLKRSKSGDIVRVAYAVTRVFHVGNGHLRMVLDNGQVWEQIGDTPRFRGQPPYPVQIIKASMGSYLMRVGKARRTVRVHRVK